MPTAFSWLACRLVMLAGVTACVAAAILLGFLFWPPLVLLLVVAAIARRKGWSGEGWSGGTASWASAADMARGGLLSGHVGHGLILGRTLGGGATRPSLNDGVNALLSAPWGNSAEACSAFLASLNKKGGGAAGKLVTLNSGVHGCVIAPSGAGKGVSFVIPALLSYQGSVIVTDPKGELFRLTAAYRRAQGHRVVRLDPFCACGPGPDTWNVLELIDPRSRTMVDEVRALAEAMVERTGMEPDPHWLNKAVTVLTAFIVFVLSGIKPIDKTLTMVRELITDPELFAGTRVMLKESNNPIYRRQGNELMSLVDKELAGVLSSVGTQTSFLDSLVMEECLGKSTFDIRDMVNGGRLTIYLILPAEFLLSHARLMRLWLTSAIRLIARQPTDTRGRILMLIDEAGQLVGQMESIETALTLLRGYGLRLWLIFQSCDQVKVAFKDKENLIYDNTDTQVWFGVNGFPTAERISKTIGSATITVESYQTNRSTSWSKGDGKSPAQSQQQRGSNASYSEQSRELLKPDEVLMVPPSDCIVLHRGVPPMRLRRVLYYADPLFGGSGMTGELGSAWLAALGVALVGGIAVFAALTALGAL